MEITASIVTYHSAQVIASCLDHLLKSTQRSLEIKLWDNHSADELASRVAPWSNQIEATYSDENLGFGLGHNAALAHATGRYLLILNPDIQLPARALDRMADYLDHHPLCGAVAPLLDEGGDKACGYATKYPGQRYARGAAAGLPGKVAILQGACLLVRAEAFREVGGFSPRFFLYGEDLDLSLRLRRKGWCLHCLTDLRVPHLGGHSVRQVNSSRVAAMKQLGLLLFYQGSYPRWSRAALVARDLLKSAWRLLSLSMVRTARAADRRREHQGRLEGTFAYLIGKTRFPEARGPEKRQPTTSSSSATGGKRQQLGIGIRSGAFSSKLQP